MLGLEVVTDLQVMPTLRWVQLRTAAAGANLSLTTFGGDAAAGALRGVMLQVDDARAAAESVRARGGTVSRQDYGTPFGSFVEVTDPDGNVIVLWQPAPGMDITAITG